MLNLSDSGPDDPGRLPEPARPDAGRREIADWEYRTSYIEYFQIRLPAGLHERLRARAGREGKAPDQLATEILEQAVRRHADSPA